MPMSDEQKKAMSDKMKARWAAKRAAETNTPEQDEVIQTSPYHDPQITTASADISLEDFETLKAQIAELKQVLADRDARAPAAPLEQPRVVGGSMVGAIEKWSTDLDRYPNPKERLAAEPKLSRFAFGENYDLKWQVTVTSYQTIDKVWQKEPRFYIELHSLARDEFTGELTGERYIVSRLFMHEDQEAALAIAREEGVDLPDPQDERHFMDELRYLRVRDWLFEAFMPKAPTPQNQAQERVINGKLVQVLGAVEKGEGLSIDWNKVARTKI